MLQNDVKLYDDITVYSVNRTVVSSPKNCDEIEGPRPDVDVRTIVDNVELSVNDSDAMYGSAQCESMNELCTNVDVKFEDVDESHSLPHWGGHTARTENLVYLHNTVASSGCYNYLGLRLSIPSSLHIDFWRTHLIGYEDEVVVEYLEYGWPINYTAECMPTSTSKNHSSAIQHSSAVEKYIATELQHNSIAGPFINNPLRSQLIFSPLHTVPKKGSADLNQRRIVFDLSYPRNCSVNDGIPKCSYLDYELDLQYPSVDDFVKLLVEAGSNCYMFKRDLSRAYRQLRIDPMDYKYLGFTWDNKIYFDVSLPFGLRSASQACQRTTSALQFIFKQRGHSLVNYIDDLAGAEVSLAKATQAAATLDDIVQKSGLQVAESKSVNATRRMVFLGILFDSTSMTMEVTSDRLADIVSELNQWRDRRKATKKQIQSLIGKLNFVAKCCKPGRVFMSRMLSALKGLQRNNHHIYLNAEFRKDILWWYQFLPHFSSISVIKCLPPQEVFATDACLAGGGGVCGSECFSLAFSDELLQVAHSITQLEIITVIIAMKLWAHSWCGLRIVLDCDNLATVHVINSGRAKDAFMQQCAREIVFLSCKHQVELVANHIPGHTNRLPDLLSRIALDGYNRDRFVDITGGRFRFISVPKDSWKFSCEW